MAVCELLGLDHVVLRAADPEALVEFYCRVLGCREERRVPEANGLIQLRAGRSLVDIVSGGGSDRAHDDANMDHFCLRIEPTDMVALVRDLEAQGIVAHHAPRVYGADGFGQSVYLRDPEGNTVELKGPSE